MGGFATKYRPIDFDTYIGNEVTKNKVLSMLKNGTLPHSMLFEGERGCGKTTLARIISKALLCKSPNKDGTPCGTCDMCVKIEDKFILKGGRVPGVPIQEIDANSEGRKDDMLSLIEEMRTKHMGNTKKVYILDEVQVVGKKAQSALLKVLEEPDPWLYIILCTTDPDDLLVPLRSRLTPFKITRPTRVEIKNHLKHICYLEQIKYEDSALDVVIKVGNRVPRECLTHLQTLANLGDVTYDSAVTNLQVVRIDTYIDYFSVINTDIFKALSYINNLYDTYDIEYIDFLEGLAEFSIDAFNIKMGVSLDKYTEEEAKAIKKVFKLVDIDKMINLLNYLEDALRLTNNPRYALVMLTLKLGFPEYFDVNMSKDDLKEEIEKEERLSDKEYRKVAKEYRKPKVDLNREATLDDITEIFSNSFVVKEG